MPNYCENELIVVGDDEDVERARDKRNYLKQTKRRIARLPTETETMKQKAKKEQTAQKISKKDIYSTVIKTIEEGDYVQSFCHLWSLIHTDPWSGEGTK